MHPQSSVGKPFTAQNAKSRLKPNPQLRHALRLLSRRINNDLRCLPEDGQGKVFLTAMRALGLPPDQMDEREAPWFRDLPAQEQQRLNDAYRSFAGFGELIEVTGKTVAELRKYADERVRCSKRCRKCHECDKRREYHWTYPMRALMQIVPLSPDELRQRNQDRNAKSKVGQLKARAERAARYSPRQIALIEAMEMIDRRPGCPPPDKMTVLNIIGAIEGTPARALFPHKHASFRRIVPRILDHLVSRGVVATETTGKPGSRVRSVTCCTAINGQKAVTPIYSYAPAKPLIHQDLAVTDFGTDLPERHSQEESVLAAMPEAPRADLAGGTTRVGEAEATSKGSASGVVSKRVDDGINPLCEAVPCPKAGDLGKAPEDQPQGGTSPGEMKPGMMMASIIIEPTLPPYPPVAVVHPRWQHGFGRVTSPQVMGDERQARLETEVRMLRQRVAELEQELTDSAVIIAGRIDHHNNGSRP